MTRSTTAVSAEERIRDRPRMSPPSDVVEFRALLTKYNVAFVLLPESNTPAIQAWQKRWHEFGVLEEAFRCSEGDVTILRVAGPMEKP